MARLQTAMSQMPQPARASRPVPSGAFHPPSAPENPRQPAPAKPGFGCKTCKGRGCVGRCRFV